MPLLSIFSCTKLDQNVKQSAQCTQKCAPALIRMLYAACLFETKISLDIFLAKFVTIDSGMVLDGQLAAKRRRGGGGSAD